jgi:hypothetical protein
MDSSYGIPDWAFLLELALWMVTLELPKAIAYANGIAMDAGRMVGLLYDRGCTLRELASDSTVRISRHAPQELRGADPTLR